jgi:hypothetical protein
MAKNGTPRGVPRFNIDAAAILAALPDPVLVVDTANRLH